jgi:hypothetical protein
MDTVADKCSYLQETGRGLGKGTKSGHRTRTRVTRDRNTAVFPCTVTNSIHRSDVDNLKSIENSSRHLPSSLRILSIATFVYERVNIEPQRMCEKTRLASSSWSTEQNWFVSTKCYWVQLALHEIKEL